MFKMMPRLWPDQRVIMKPLPVQDTEGFLNGAIACLSRLYQNLHTFRGR